MFSASETVAGSDFENAVAHLAVRAAEVWPGVVVDSACFADRLAEIVGASPDLANLHTDELYLACACARGDRRALEYLEGELAKLERAIASVHTDPVFIDDVRQQLRHDLFVADAQGRPRIMDYAGRGPLAAWLRVVAVRTALNLRRGRAPSTIDDDALQIATTEPDPELDYLKARCRAEFKEAFVAALHQLPPTQRTALRVHHLDGLTLEETARVCSVSRATVARWLADARERLLRDTQQRLAERLRLSKRELESILGIVQSQLDISIHRCLRDAV